MGTAAEGKRIRIRGTVQGVGFRPWVYRVALQTGIRGRVRNDSSGVTIDAFGDEQALQEFERALHLSPPSAARIADVDTVAIPSEVVASFVIEHSTPTPYCTSRFRLISRRAPRASPTSSTWATDGSVMRSPTARTAGPESRSPWTSRTTARRRHGSVRHVRGARQYADLTTAGSTRSPPRAQHVDLDCECGG